VDKLLGVASTALKVAGAPRFRRLSRNLILTVIVFVPNV